jgi:hypothetical protein
MAQVTKSIPSKCEALSSNPALQYCKIEREERGRKWRERRGREGEKGRKAERKEEREGKKPAAIVTI